MASAPISLPAAGGRGTAQTATSLCESLTLKGGVVPDHETATPSDGGCGDRTRDLLLAKAQHTVQQGDTNGTEHGVQDGSAAAAATRHRTPTESLRETDPVGVVGRALLEALREYERETVNRALIDLRDHGHGWPPTENGRACALAAAFQRITSIDWTALEHHARALDRSEACHTLRVRADQAAGQQRHVRATVSHVRRAVGA